MATQNQLNNSPAVIPNTPSQTMVDLTSAIHLSESSDAVYHYFVASPMYAGFGDLGSPDRVNFLESFSTMSPNLRNYMSSADTVEFVFSIGKEFGLDDSQISELGILIRELLIGKIFIKDFPITLSSRLGIDDVKAGELTNALVSKSFAPIIEDLKRVQRNKFPDKIQQLQKENKPVEGLTQSSARPIEARPPTSAQQLQQNQPSVPPIRPATPTPPPVIAPAPALPILPPKNEEMQNRGSSISQSRPVGGEIGTKPTPPTAPVSEPKLAPLPPMPPEIGASPQAGPSRPVADIQPAKPSFKIPDLGQPITKENSEKKGEVAQKSLEAELEKVANVIDLRSQSKE